MRHRILSLALAGLAILALAGSAFAQVAITGSPIPGSFTGGTPMTSRFDVIAGFAQATGVPPVASGTFQPRVVATDAAAADAGTILAPYVTDLDAWFASNFGWRSTRPVTFLLFSDSQGLAAAAGAIRGSPITADEFTGLQGQQSILLQSTQNFDGITPGDQVILVNTDAGAAMQTASNLSGAFMVETGLIPLPPTNFTSDDGFRLIEESMARNYALLMENDQAGSAGPPFYREGLANAIAYRLVPGTPMEPGQTGAAGFVLATTGSVPSVSDLESNWTGFAGSGGINFDVAQGLAFLSANTILNTSGNVAALDILRDTAAGQNFDTALQTRTGFTPTSLNTAIQPLIPPAP